MRKLLAKAEDPACTSAEAEAFTAKAAELIAKYGVDQALLVGADPALDPVGDLAAGAGGARPRRLAGSGRGQGYAAGRTAHLGGTSLPR